MSLFASEGEEFKKHKKIVRSAMRGEHTAHVEQLANQSALEIVEQLKEKKNIPNTYEFILKNVSSIKRFIF